MGGKLELDDAVACIVGLGDLINITNNDPVLIDIRGKFSKDEAQRKGFYYKAL